MIAHKSLFSARDGRRRSSPTTRLGACSCTCRARGAQALRCYKPPHGGKTTRGRAFVVGIGHPRRELSPGRRYRARRGATYEVVALVTVREEGRFFTWSARPRGPQRIRGAEKRDRAAEKCAVDFGTRDVNLRNFVPADRASAICGQRGNRD